MNLYKIVEEPKDKFVIYRKVLFFWYPLCFKNSHRQTQLIVCNSLQEAESELSEYIAEQKKKKQPKFKAVSRFYNEDGKDITQSMTVARDCGPK